MVTHPDHKAHVEGLLLLEGCRFSGPVRLTGARVVQALSLRDAELRGDPALMAGGLSVGRNLVCSGMSAGECRMPNAQISGTLYLDGASLIRPGRVALAADGLTAEQGVFCTGGFTAEGEVVLQDARIGRQMTDGRGHNPQPTWQSGRRRASEHRRALYLDDGFSAEGQVMLRSATIQGTLYLGGKLANPSRSALNANRATIESGIYARPGLVIRGETSLGGAHVHGSVDLTAAHLENPQGRALVADRAEVTGRFFCGSGFAAEGEIRLVDARIGAGLYFTGAKLSSTSGPTLTAWGLAVTGVVDCCDGFTADGPISLVSARLDSELCFEAAVIHADVNLRRLHAAVVRANSQTVIDGVVDLRHSTVEILRDDPAGWPRAAYLDGFTYTTLVSPIPAADRLRLLEGDPDGYHPQPYEQLAAVYRSMGDDADARTILLAKQRARRQTISAPLRAWGLIQDWMVGYGYRPLRAALWLGALLLIGSVAFGIHRPAPLNPSQAPEFNPFLYTLDLLVPIVGFGQKDAFNPHGWQHWLAAIGGAAASAWDKPAGLRASWRDGAATHSAYAPAGRGKNGMPYTSSPGRNLVTPGSMSSTTPQTSQPRTNGGSPSSGNRPDRITASTEFTPQDMDLLRHGAMPVLFGELRAPSALGSFLRSSPGATCCNWARCTANSWRS